MIYNKTGNTQGYDGMAYTVGQLVIGASGNLYSGLYGHILEIRTGRDSSSPHQEPEIVCAFLPPVLPYEIARVEQRFSALAGKPISLSELNLDRVVLSPQQIDPLDPLEDRARGEIWVLTEDWAMWGDYGSSCDLFVSFADGRRVMAKRLHTEQTSGCIARWRHRSDFVIDAGKNDYTVYLDGDYEVNHYTLALKKHFLVLPAWLPPGCFQAIAENKT